MFFFQSSRTGTKGSIHLLFLLKQVKIPILEITKLNKRKVLGLFNSNLEIYTVNRIFIFCSMPQRDEAYERISALCKTLLSSKDSSLGDNNTLRDSFSSLKDDGLPQAPLSSFSSQDVSNLSERASKKLIATQPPNLISAKLNNSISDIAAPDLNTSLEDRQYQACKRSLSMNGPEFRQEISMADEMMVRSAASLSMKEVGESMHGGGSM